MLEECYKSKIKTPKSDCINELFISIIVQNSHKIEENTFVVVSS